MAIADEPEGLYALATGSRQAQAHPDPDSVLKLSRANAVENWSLTASASRKPWDPTQPLGVILRSDPLDAMAGDSSRASLAFDWQRRLATGRVEAAAFAMRASVNLFSDLSRFDGASNDERFEQRDRRSIFGAALRWGGRESVAGLASSTAVSARVRSEAIDAEGVFSAQGRQPLDTVREDRLRQSSAAFIVENETRLGRGLKSVASVRYDGYRFGVVSDLAGHGGSGSGGVLSPHFSLIASPAAGIEIFADAGRGLGADDPRSPGAAFDPRTSAPLGRLDPLASLATTQIGVRGQWLPGVTASVSRLRAAADSELILTGDAGFAQLARPSVRQGLQVAARYEPTPWLAFDLQAARLRARFADGASEYIPGAAERTASAGATLKVVNGWRASLLVSSFGRRPALSDDSPRLKSSTFVNARLSRNLSRNTRVTLDVFNVFDQSVGDIDYFSTMRVWNQPGAGDSFLFNPAEPRGFRIKLRTTF